MIYILAGVLRAAPASLISVRLLAATGAFWAVSLNILPTTVTSFVAVLLLSGTYPQWPLCPENGRDKTCREPHSDDPQRNHARPTFTVS